MSAPAVTIAEWREQMLPHFTATAEAMSRHLQDETARVATQLDLEHKLFMVSWRIKEVDRAAGTALRRGMDYWKLPDWAGFRISCPTPDAAYHLSLSTNTFPDWEVGRRFDYNINPKVDGYRGIHVYGRARREDVLVPCEIQIHTRLQSLWSDLTHDDIYKPASRLSVLARDTATNLAVYMSATDQLIGRMFKILRKPEDQLKFEETADLHHWIAILALLDPSLSWQAVEPIVKQLRSIGLESHNQLQFLHERFEKVERQVLEEWKRAGCATPSKVTAMGVCARLIVERIGLRDQSRRLAQWAREQAETERRDELSTPEDNDDV